MSKAEERAKEAFPIYGRGDVRSTYRALFRDAFIEGYEQATKDLALTWEDIKRIDDLMMEVLNSIAVGELPEMGIKEIYQEVLKRFNQIR